MKKFTCLCALLAISILAISCEKSEPVMDNQAVETAEAQIASAETGTTVKMCFVRAWKWTGDWALDFEVSGTGYVIYHDLGDLMVPFSPRTGNWVLAPSLFSGATNHTEVTIHRETSDATCGAWVWFEVPQVYERPIRSAVWTGDDHPGGL